MNNNHSRSFLFFLASFYFPSILSLCYNGQLTMAALPATLNTNSRWIVDENERRVKLACTNWVSHLQPVVAEGLSKQPLDSISKKIRSMGFNCVRLTWPLFLATNDTLASITVRKSFQSLGLLESISGIQANNPSLLDLPLIEALKAVVSNLGENDVMVILDNHLSKPGWCCSNFDDNGFFGDKYFHPQLWIKGLTKMASIFNGSTSVVGMSLRNELRGPKQNVNNWYKYMQQGAEAVHAANPNILVILSGLNFDADLSFLAKQPVNLTFTGKLVCEVHLYAFTNSHDWENGNVNQVCGNVMNNWMRRAGFLLEQGVAPLFLSEFGMDQRGTDVNDNRYFNCMMGVAAELDLDWAL
ncbi:glycosyl hydrolase 5 family protein-like [Papaver somniferum]|uniref:glycosyl hydrolase 5 family protein-like n=1 Tax=Papaver somniferum TaxID=3469 RepID=UPI000E700C50|nr:glycosyl hydrolase 5 family protein-like [Papaver somniferum]